MALLENKIYPALIEGYSSDGAGIARIEGMVVFVKGGIKGEQADVYIEHIGHNAAWGHIEHLTEASPTRMEPDCPYYGECGGCQFRHMTYAEELEAKKTRVQDALSRIGGSEVRVSAIHGAEIPSRYRNKVQFPVGGSSVGYYKGRTHQVIDIEDCLLQPEEDTAARHAVKNWMTQYRIPAYNEKTGKGLLRHLYLRTNSRGQVLCCLVVNGREVPHSEELISALRQAVPGLAGVVLSVNTRKTNVILGDKFYTLWGADRLEETLCGHSFRLSVPSFFQINRAQTEVLYGRALEFAQLTGGETVVDLYCGIGTISLTLAEQAGQVIGVEVVPQAIEDAKENAIRNGLEHKTRFECGDASDLAAQLESEGIRPDVVVVDPPRKGLAPDVVDTIVRMAPERVVYVSCDPATLGRDVKRFEEQGYKAVKAEAVDLFPRTAHIEGVVCLSREKANLANQNFRMAQQGDAEHVLSLYQSAKSSAFCVWNDSYPSITEIEHDLETNNLYVMTDGSKIIGAISVAPENELDGFDCWSCSGGKEIARVVIDKAYQGQGLSFEMVQRVESILREKGRMSIRLSVVKSNTPAYKTYIKAGFAVVGEAQMYGNDYYLMDKVIDTTSLPKRITDESVCQLTRKG